MDQIAVLIPCYNESKTINKVIMDFKHELPEATIYVYDNNSIDQTSLIAKNAGAIVRHEKRQGKGNVIRRMFREIDSKVYIMVDGDDTYPAEYSRKMADVVLNEDVDMVIGDRLSSTYFTENKRLFHNTGNKLVRTMINRIFKSDIKDIMTGYRAFSFKFVKTFPVLSKGFEIETEMTIHSLDKNLNIHTEIVDYRDRPEGSVSKLRTVSDGYKVVKTILKLFKNYRPFNFFCFLSFILFVIGLTFLVPVMIKYISTGMVPNFPSFIASIFFFLCAVHAFFSGMILNTINIKNQHDFELKYTDYYYKYKQLLDEEK